MSTFFIFFPLQPPRPPQHYADTDELHWLRKAGYYNFLFCVVNNYLKIYAY